MLAGAGLAPAPAFADGFGWYLHFFDYEELRREFAGELGKAWKPVNLKDVWPNFRPAMEGSAFPLLDLMEHSQRIHLTHPKNDDEELLWAEALLQFGLELQRRNPQSPGRFFVTGRQFRAWGDMPACKRAEWIHGACGSSVMFTPEEVAVLAGELDALADSKVKWREPEMQDELRRLRGFLREAAESKRAVFFYGHD